MNTLNTNLKTGMHGPSRYGTRLRFADPNEGKLVERGTNETGPYIKRRSLDLLFNITTKPISDTKKKEIKMGIILKQNE